MTTNDEPKSTRRYITERRGHTWRKNERGEIDIMAYNVGFHNGPVCEKCGYGFCHHCDEIPDEECTVPGDPTPERTKLPVPAARDLLRYALEGLDAMPEDGEIDAWDLNDLLFEAIKANPEYLVGGLYFLSEVNRIDAGDYHVPPEV